MKYYFLDFENNNDLFFSENVIIDPNDWLRNKSFGEPITHDKVKIKLMQSSGVLHEYLANIHGLLILRKDVVDCIQNIQSSHFQKFKVEIDKGSEQDYYFIHLCNHIDAIIVEESDVVRAIPNIPVYDEIKNLTLDSSQIKNRHIFSIKGIPNKVAVSDKLKSKLEEKCELQITNFINCDGYHWKISPFT